MKSVFQKLLVIVALCAAVQYAYSKPAFTSGGKYRIVATMVGTGSLVTGAEHGQETPLYYSTDDESSADAFWIFTEVSEGVYTIQNASTLKYITYDGERTNSKRYLDLTDEADEANSQWKINVSSGSFEIELNSYSGRRFNLRSATYMLGTYDSSGSAAQNELFTFVDANGKTVANEVVKEVVKFSTHIDSLLINGKVPVYNKTSGRYMITVPANYKNENFIVPVYAKFADSTYTLRISGKKYVAGENVNFGNVSGGKNAYFSLYSGSSSVESFRVDFTFMPIVEVTCSSFNTYSYTQGSIRVTDPEAETGDTLISAGFRYRGATASGKAKKAYAVKLYDAAGESTDVSFFGLRSDNNWILDAMAIDRARMRNRVSTDLWLDFSAKTYLAGLKKKSVNGTRGRFVEVLLNGQYAGIYCMTEKVDRKQLQLKKIKLAETEAESDTVRGVLYKSTQWSYSVMMGHNPDNKSYPKTSVSTASSSSEEWDSWEAKYPDLSDASSIEWEPLREALNVVAKGSKTTFTNRVETYFDMPVWKDYYLFIELMLATDNHGKNLYMSNFDQTQYKMMTVTPWDLDGTWGIRWDGGTGLTSNAAQDFTTFLWNYEHGELTLYYLLNEYDYKDWKAGLAERYAELRANYFHPDSLYKRFSTYNDLFEVSGASSREVTRWNNSDGIALDFDSEMSYIKSWIASRVEYLDKQYGFDASVLGINTLRVDRFTASGAEGRIIVTSDNGIKLRIHTTDGVLVRTFDAPTGVSEITGLDPGIYIVNGKKVMVR